jgi:hypothetical protein
MSKALSLALGVLAILAPLACSSPKAAPAPLAQAGPDHGLLEASWFGNPDLPFRQGKHVSFYWVKPGLDLQGRTVREGAWSPVAMRRPDATPEDRAKAEELNAKLPQDLEKGIWRRLEGRGGVRFSRDGGDYVLTGRVVDYHPGSVASKVGTTFSLATGRFAGAIIEKAVRKEKGIPEDQGKECVTFDLKLEDARTREVVLAIHQKTFDPYSAELSFEKWSRHLGRILAGEMDS